MEKRFSYAIFSLMQQKEKYMRHSLVAVDAKKSPSDVPKSFFYIYYVILQPILG